MRYTFWQLKYLSPDDLQSRRLVIADNAEGCPDEIKRLQMRWRNGDDSRVALVPTFEDRIGKFVPLWLLKAMRSGNVQPVFIIKGENPEVDAVVALSVIHYFMRLQGGGMRHEWLKNEFFPRGPVPFVRCNTTLPVAVPDSALLWHSGYVHKNADELFWSKQFARLDQAWCHHVVRNAQKLKVRWEQANADEDSGCLPVLLVQSFLLQTVHVFAPLMAWTALDLESIIKEQIDEWLLTDRRYPYSSAWLELQRKLHEQDIYDDLEKRIDEAIAGSIAGTGISADDGDDSVDEHFAEVGLPEDGAAAEDLVSKLAVIAQDFSKEIFATDLPHQKSAGGSVDGTQPDESVAPKLCILREYDKVKLGELSPGERFLSMMYADRHGLGRTKRCAKRWDGESQRDDAADSNATSEFRCTAESRDLFNAALNGNSRWNLIHGCCWLRNVPEDFTSHPMFAAGSTIELWPPMRMIVGAIDITGSGMAGFSLHVPVPEQRSDAEIVVHVIPKHKTWKDTAALVPGVEEKDITKPFTPPSSAEEQTAVELRTLWRKVTVTVVVEDGEPIELWIDKGDGYGARRVNPGEPDVKACKLISQEGELTAPGKLLLTVAPSPNNAKKTALKLQNKGKRKALERLRTALKTYTSIGVVAERGKQNTPFSRILPVEGDGDAEYHEIDFDLEVRRP